MDTYTCEKCGHEWVPRPLTLGRTKPIRCPRCMSTTWDKPREQPMDPN